jgi:dTDP-4-amino-4,6-dideoxygalactose transaminase
MSKVKFLDLKRLNSRFSNEFRDALDTCLNSGSFIAGELLFDFENEFASFVGSSNCVGVGNGFDALTLGLKTLGVAPGDEVLVPSFTYIATWNAVKEVGAVPVSVPVLDKSFNMDPDRIQEFISSKTKAIIPVHLFGQPALIDEIVKVAKNNDLSVIEDAAQAHGAEIDGVRIGAHGDLVAWSFYPGKNLGALGDGGAVTTNSLELAERVRVIGNYGSKVKYKHDILGVNSRLDPLQAQFLKVKLSKLSDMNQARQRVAEIYNTILQDVPGVKLPSIDSRVKHVWHLYVIRVSNRDMVQKMLAAKGIETLIPYPISHFDQGCYQGTEVAGADAGVEQSREFAGSVLSLPMDPFMSEEDAEYVAYSVRIVVDSLA